MSKPIVALSFGLGLLSTSLLAALAFASPPEEVEVWTETEGLAGLEDQLELDPALRGEQGFWLSLELIGPRGAQIDAGRSVAGPPVIEALPRGAPVPGELVGRIETLDDALRWVNTHAFAPLDDSDSSATPIPGGALLREFDVVVTALVVTGPIPSGATAYPWPPANAMPLPEDLAWQPASFAAARVPVFAAPASELPPASERYQVAALDDAVWQLDRREVCGAEGRCLVWAQVIVRHGDRFFGGWIPATHVIPDDAWVGGPGERRLALLPSHRDREQVGFALIEQRGDRREAPVGLARAHVGPAWPDTTLDVLGETLVVTIGGETMLTRQLETPPLVLTPY